VLGSLIGISVRQVCLLLAEVEGLALQGRARGNHKVARLRARDGLDDVLAERRAKNGPAGRRGHCARVEVDFARTGPARKLRVRAGLDDRTLVDPVREVVQDGGGRTGALGRAARLIEQRLERVDLGFKLVADGAIRRCYGHLHANLLLATPSRAYITHRTHGLYLQKKKTLKSRPLLRLGRTSECFYSPFRYCTFLWGRFGAAERAKPVQIPGFEPCLRPADAGVSN